MSVRISHDQYAATLTRVNAINARAAKRGLSGRLTVTGTPVTVSELDPATGLTRVLHLMDVTIGGDPPKHDGWSFIASLEWDVNAGLIVRTAPGVETVDHATLKQGWCDYCRTKRNRVNVYLVRHEDGREMQLGSTCIKDALGWDGRIVWTDPSALEDEISEGIGSGAWHEDYGTEYVLAVAWALIKLDGYRPASSWSDSTKGSVMSVLKPPHNLRQAERDQLARIRALALEASQRAAECRAWVLSNEFNGDSEYVRNLKAIARADSVSWRSIGYLVSAPQTWARHLERTLIREADTRPSAWVGTVGERVIITATVEAIRFIESDWGGTVLYTLRDAAGNLYKWFASREALGDVTGEQVTVKATVKKHDEYNGVQQTVITRAKVQPVH